jgi:hypothetical protein
MASQRATLRFFPLVVIRFRVSVGSLQCYLCVTSPVLEINRDFLIIEARPWLCYCYCAYVVPPLTTNGQSCVILTYAARGRFDIDNRGGDACLVKRSILLRDAYARRWVPYRVCMQRCIWEFKSAIVCVTDDTWGHCVIALCLSCHRSGSRCKGRAITSRTGWLAWG